MGGVFIRALIDELVHGLKGLDWAHAFREPPWTRMCCHVGLGGAHGTPSDRDSEGI